MLKIITHLVTFLLWNFQEGLSLDQHLNRVQPPSSPWFGPIMRCNRLSRRSPSSWSTNLELSPTESPRRTVATSVVLPYTIIFFLLHKSGGKKKVLFHLCNRTNYLQAKGMLGDHALCLVGPARVPGRLCPQEWINLETRAGWRRRRWLGGCRGHGSHGGYRFPHHILPLQMRSCGSMFRTIREAVNRHPHTFQ